MVEFVYNVLVFVLNTIIVLFSKVLTVILSILPTSPFINVVSYVRNSSINTYLEYLAWLIPIKNIIIIFGVWLGAMLVYYIYSVVMRYIKLIG